MQLVNRLFKYLKKVLSYELYSDIKRQFREDTQKNDESQSSIFNYVKCEEMLMMSNREKLLKLSCDFGGNNKTKEKPIKIEVKGIAFIPVNDKGMISIGEGSNCIKENETRIMEYCNVIKKDKDSNCLAISGETMIGKESSGNSNKQSKKSLYHLTKSRINTPTIMKKSNTGNMSNCSNNKIGGAIKSNKVNINLTHGNRSKTQSNSKSTSRDASYNAYSNVIAIAKSAKKNTNKKMVKEKEPSSLPSSNPISSIPQSNPIVKNDTININLSKDKPDPSSSSAIDNNTTTPSMNKSTPILNGKLFSKLTNDNPNLKKEISIETIDLYSNNPQTKDYTKQKSPKDSTNNGKRRISNIMNIFPKAPHLTIKNKIINKSTGAVTTKHSPQKDDNKTKVISSLPLSLPLTLRANTHTQFIDLTKSDEHRLSPKNDEMLKEIKMSLDDNLKYFFNFSYEHFLSKESESQSKKSQEINEPSL